MHTPWRGRGALAALLALLVMASACRPPPGERTQVTPVSGPAGATRYQIDAPASRLTLFLRADGPLARLGHNHVITTHGLEGSLWLHPQLERSACEIRLPVASLVVDDPQERAAAGGDFAQPLDDDARAGTRNHMLGASQLDAEHYPVLTLRCSRVSATPGGALLEFTVMLRGHAAPLAVPVHWEVQGGTVSASGEFHFQQSDLGFEPYSAVLGAMRVADTIAARFSIVARAP